MPGIGEILTLTAPQPGDLSGPLPPAQVVANEDSTKSSEENGALPSKPNSVTTQTKSIGMIHPPPDIRSIVDKTAQFVARNGLEFEKKILMNEKNNVKFNFLNPSDPYHAYYQHRVSEYKAQVQVQNQAPNLAAAMAVGSSGAAQESKPAPVAPGTAVSTPAPIEPPPPKIEAFLRPIKVLEPPESEQYTVRLPEGLTGQDLDTIKLTAQSVARNGRSFLAGLTDREHSSAQFFFLKPTHSMFSFFTALTDAYYKVLLPPKGLVDKLKKDLSDRTIVLERCLHRLEWERSQERARQKAEDEIEQERMQMALIDWHDFVVVETIEFAEDEEEELPQPMTMEEVIRRSKMLSTGEEEERVEAVKEVEMEMDVEEMQMVEESMRVTTLDGNHANYPEEIIAPPLDDQEPPMRIVKNWKRPEDRLPAEKDPTKVVVSPITGEHIPVNEMAEHMRISLIDPKYKEQKERMMAKLRETTLATDDEISRNIVGLARTRPDIFGTTEEEVSNAVKAEIEKKKEEPKQVIWDGHTGSISRTANQAMAQMNVDEQGNDGLLPGPLAPPKLAPVRPLPPPPGLAVNLPRPVLQQGSSGISMSTIPAPPPRPSMMAAPSSLRPPMPPTMPNMAGNYRPMLPPTGQMPGSMTSQMPQFTPLQPRPFLPPMPPAMPLGPPPSMGHAMPPLPDEEAPPLPPDEPEPKRQKLDELQLIPEDQYLAQHPGPVRITVSVPIIEGEGNFKGQMLEIPVHSLSESIGNLKEKIASEIALPANKQKLSGRAGFLKDNLSLAFYNIGPGEMLTLGLRERGGRKR